jgi:hypothetical protein
MGRGTHRENKVPEERVCDLFQELNEREKVGGQWPKGRQEK